MRISATLENPGALNGASARVRAGFKREAFAVGAIAVERVKRELLSGPTSATQTEVRSGQRRRSYGHRVGTSPQGITLDVGAIKPGPGGKIPIQSRVHEGYDAGGNRVASFTIKAKNAPYLVFPIRRGPGLAKGNIVGWVRTKEVTLIPRPTFELVEKIVTPALQERAAKVLNDAVQ